MHVSRIHLSRPLLYPDFTYLKCIVPRFRDTTFGGAFDLSLDKDLNDNLGNRRCRDSCIMEACIQDEDKDPICPPVRKFFEIPIRVK